jgi:hypothetical protein
MEHTRHISVNLKISSKLGEKSKLFIFSIVDMRGAVDQGAAKYAFCGNNAIKYP